MSNSVRATIPSSTVINLRRLVVIRAIAFAGQGIAVWMAVTQLALALPLRPLLLILASMALLSLATWWRSHLPFVVRESELLGQLIIDVAALTGLFYFTGGATNPFVTLFLLPLAFAAAALPTSHAWTLATLTTACYTLLLFHFVSLPASHAGHAHDFKLHVLGMWFGFVSAAGLIAGFAVRMSSTLRERDRLVAEMREQAIYQERMLALATLAAGAAHELGTPLSTMAVLLKDLAPDQPLPAEKIDILRSQVARCKEILASLSATAGAARAEGGTRVALDSWLDDTLHKWQAMRPGINTRARFTGDYPVPWIVAEQTLTQAITNILNNAADASPENVAVEGHWNDDELTLEVADRGPGLAPEVRDTVGEPFTTTKDPDKGLGLGLFLAYTTLSRFGGTVLLMNREHGGVRCRLTLPLAAIKVST
ncbi:two-component system, sensor histidine kinase RegB [Gammaproteobacteria bacterium]